MAFREAIADFGECFQRDWKPLSTPAFVAWSMFYLLFLLYAFAHRGEFLLIDNVNLVIHEAGHPLFSYLGQTPMMWGGTIFELMVPFLLAMYFAYLREAQGTAFCAFFFFENFLYIATYMADARAMALPLVSTGEFAEHDWNFIFSQLGLLQHDTRVAAVVNFLGWSGMIATVSWLGWRWRSDQSRAEAKKSVAAAR